MALAGRKSSKPNKSCENYCNDCNEIVQDDDKNTINCDLCRKWYHKACTSIKTAEWKVLIGNPNILYSCDICLEKQGNEASEMREIKELMTEHFKETKQLMTNMEEKLFKKVDKLIDEKLAKQNQKQEKLENMIKDVKETELRIEEKIQAEVKVYLDHQKEKESKLNNIIILRMKEQDGKDDEEIIENDRKEIKKLLKKTNPELTAEIDKVLDQKKSFRLGKKKEGVERPRPIKLELPDEDMKRQIFRGCRNLRNSDYNNVSIQNDLTREEQQQSFKLRQELKQRKENGEQVCIYNGRIIEEKEHPRRK